MTESLKIRTLINRIGRIDAADGWSDDLNPTQLAALGYLALANRFSRAPSHVADFLGTTRGTMSQTLKALERKGYISELRSKADKRYMSYDLTTKGRIATERPNPLEQALSITDATSANALESALERLLQTMLKTNKGRAFGQCFECTHFRTNAPKGHCNLLSVPLAPAEIEQICHEQVPK